MSDTERGSPARSGLDYLILTLAGLGFVTVVLVQEGLDLWAALPFAMGALGVALPGSVSPSLVLALMSILLVWRSGTLRFGHQHGSSALSDLLLALAVLAYVVGSTRYLTIRRHAVPPDPRREQQPEHERLVGRWLLPHKPTRRSGEGVAAGEVARFLLAAPFFVLAAYLVWVNVAFAEPPVSFDVPVPLYRALVVVWAGTLALLVGYVMLAYLGRTHASREESLLYLQDQLWDATRGEQRQAHRWLARARLRQQRKEERR